MHTHEDRVRSEPRHTFLLCPNRLTSRMEGTPRYRLALTVRCLILVALVMTACGSSSPAAPPLALAFHKGDVYSFTFQLTANEAINGIACGRSRNLARADHEL